MTQKSLPGWQWGTFNIKYHRSKGSPALGFKKPFEVHFTSNHVEKRVRFLLCYRISISQCDMVSANSILGDINRYLVQNKRGNSSVVQWSNITA